MRPVKPVNCRSVAAVPGGNDQSLATVSSVNASDGWQPRATRQGNYPLQTLRARRERLEFNVKMSARICKVLLAIALMPAGVAGADTSDDSFLKALADQGIIGDPNQLITEGHTVCDDVSGSHLATNAPRWTNFPALGPVMGDLHLSLFQARFFINAAESAYCPQFVGLERRRFVDPTL